MRKLHFNVNKININGFHDLKTDITITVDDVTMFVAAWEDPEHWAEDWAEQLGVSQDDVPDAVAALLAGAIVEGD